MNALTSPPKLWIAFKFVSLYQLIQQVSYVRFALDVVNCFQICIFVSVNTTESTTASTMLGLWIAFKFVSLYQLIQRDVSLTNGLQVVNCFQICIFVSVNTTRRRMMMAQSGLWIAFKFVSLYQLIQLCCGDVSSVVVVNCFQICIFVSVNTTDRDWECCAAMLWIAFKFVSLYQLIQQYVQ